MEIPTHLLSGWLLANGFELSPRERFLAMVAATAPDIDGVGALWDPNLYVRWHHVAGHNLLFSLGTGVLLAAGATRRVRFFLLALLLVHLHLALDYLGSGPGWGIAYLWPFSRWALVNPRAWNFYSWQNSVAFYLALAGCLAVSLRHRRTPCEFILPVIDQALWRRNTTSPQ